MKLALAFSSKDQVALTEQTLPKLFGTSAYIYWCDGSVTPEGVEFFERHNGIIKHKTRITGGADAALAWKLSTLLAAPEQYTHIGLVENDVLLDPDWLEPTLAMFEKGKQDGLEVGAVSPRSYIDRVLIQRAGYSVMHNIGAGIIIFTREAAEIALASFRTHYWQDNVKLFAQLSGIDLRTYAAFRGNEQQVTTDWGWEAQIARHGLAALALTPAKCRMIGQNPPLAEQGLELAAKPVCHFWKRNDREVLFNSDAFETWRDILQKIRSGIYKIDEPGIIQRFGSGMLFYPHQLGYLAGGPQWQGNLELQWCQGHGPFAYRAGAGGASLSLRVSGTFSFLVGGGVSGAQASIRDTRSGFNFDPALPAMEGFAELNVPGSPIPRTVTLELSQGAVFYGVQTVDSQMLDTSFRFSWDQLPAAAPDDKREVPDYIVWSDNGVVSYRTASGEIISKGEFERRVRDKPNAIVMNAGQNNA